MSNDWTESSIPDLSGKVTLVTGANSGIGFEAARALAQHGADVVLACRNEEKAADALDRISATEPAGTAETLDLDLSDLDSVEAASTAFAANQTRLDMLVNNAGLMFPPLQRTAQGFEMQLGVNHLGHFALTGHLMATLLKTSGSRIVNVSSFGHRPGRMNFDDLNAEHGYSPYRAYFQSKLANLLFTNELQRRLTADGASTIAVAAHPGASDTNLGHESPGGVAGALMNAARPVTDLMTQSAAMGALPTLRAATDPDANGGDYYGPPGRLELRGHPVKVGMSGQARSTEDAQRLWSESEDLTGVSYLD